MKALSLIDLSSLLRQVRDKHGYSQEYVAFQVGISQPAYCQRESGQTEVSFSLLQRIAAVYDLTVVELLLFKPGPTAHLKPAWNDRRVASSIAA
jgi:transcriptional regulator with XRE-family HTH domain